MLNDTIGMSLPDTKTHILEKLVEFTGSKLDHDDVTFLIMNFKPPGEN